MFVALEVDDTVSLFMAATDVSDCQTTLVVAAACFFQGTQQRLLRSSCRDVRKIGQRHIPASCGGWIHFAGRHFLVPNYLLFSPFFPLTVLTALQNLRFKN
jgi:hypothetical protein